MIDQRVQNNKISITRSIMIGIIVAVVSIAFAQAFSDLLYSSLTISLTAVFPSQDGTQNTTAYQVVLGIIISIGMLFVDMLRSQFKTPLNYLIIILSSIIAIFIIKFTMLLLLALALSGGMPLP